MFRWLKSLKITGFLVFEACLGEPNIALLAFIWRSVADASCKILLGDDPSDLEPEVSIIPVLDFCLFKALFN